MAHSRSIEAFPKHNLPPQTTSFVGRDPEIAELVDLLEQPDCRLITLIGPGGIGKTRLAIEAASRQIEAFAHGIFFVALAPLSTATDIVPTIINVLGIYLGDDSTPREQLVTFLSQRNLLLITDNFEHVLDGANLVADILNAAPGVKILATSREGLNLRMERVWHVRGMRYPDTDQPENIDQYSALRLFIDRATWVRREFSPLNEQACAIRICQLVGGMPLAIELAASWLKSLTCEEIGDEIQRNMDFLATNVRDIPERHRSIRAVCDHSWSLCSETEQAVFSKLCVFHGGFEREAAVEVAGASLLTLSALVEKSMLRKLPSGRYEIHELLRQYAEDKLTAAGELAAIEDAHTQYYAALMQACTPDIKGRRQLAGLNEIDANLDNVRAAWQRAIAEVDYDALDQMMEGLALFCDMRAHYQLGEDLFQQAVDALASQGGEVAHPVWNRLRARWIQTWILKERMPIPNTIREQLDNTVTVAKEQDDTATVALCLWSSGELHRIEIDGTRGLPLYKIALTHFGELGDKYYIVRVLRGMVFCYGYMGRDYWGTMLELNHEHLNLAREIGDRTGMGHAFFYEGMTSFNSGRSRDSTEDFLLQALAIWQEMGDRKSVGNVLGALGNLYRSKANWRKPRLYLPRQSNYKKMSITGHQWRL